LVAQLPEIEEEEVTGAFSQTMMCRPRFHAMMFHAMMFHAMTSRAMMFRLRRRQLLAILATRLRLWDKRPQVQEAFISAPPNASMATIRLPA
jgi:hypothetical protein